MSRRIKVLRIQHNFVEPTNHRLLDELERFPELEIRALCPEWGIESGNLRELRNPDRPDLETAPTVFTRHYATTLFVKKLSTTIRRYRPDVISVHEEPYSLIAGQAILYRKLYSPESKIIFCSAQNILKNMPPPFSAIEKWMYREAAAGYGCCEGVVEVGRAKGFKGIYEVFPLGMDPELFRYRRRGKDVAGREFVVGYVGQVVREKGVFDLLEAFRDLNGNARLVYLGGGPSLEEIRNTAEKMGISDRVETPGPVPHVDVPKTMDRFDVLVVPSHTTPTWKEQFGRVIPEAYSMGIPVIGSSSGSIPEVVGEAGLIFPEKDVPALTSILQSLVDNPEKLVAMSEKGRALAVEEYSWAKVAELNRDLFFRVMEEK